MLRILLLLALASTFVAEDAFGQESRRAESRSDSRTARKPAATSTKPSLTWAEVVEPKPSMQAVPSATHRAAMTKTGLPWRVRDKTSGIEMLLIPPGAYTRGAAKEGADDEKPAHQVSLSRAFYLGRFEVTNVQFRKFRPEHHSGEFEKISLDGDTLPVVSVSWDDAKAYCSAMGLRLPTEGEWEYATRAGTTSRHPWGDSPSAGKGWTNALGPNTRTRFKFDWDSFDFEDQYDVAAPVGTFKPNGWGFFDMPGNVWEWCEDFFADSYSAWASGVTDPGGPAAGEFRVVRGGSWFGGPWYARSSARIKGEPSNRGTDIGFRAARSP